MANGKSGYLREQMEQTAMTVLQALKVKQDHRAMKDLQVLLESTATLVLLDLKVSKVSKVFQVK
jgi:hypothetical protein